MANTGTVGAGTRALHPRFVSPWGAASHPGTPEPRTFPPRAWGTVGVPAGTWHITFELWACGAARLPPIRSPWDQWSYVIRFFLTNSACPCGACGWERQGHVGMRYMSCTHVLLAQHRCYITSAWSWCTG